MRISLDAKRAVTQKQKILYITERAVFELLEGELTLIEIAPGIDLQRHILDLLDFEVKVHRDLKQMDRKLFLPEAMGIAL